MDTILMVLHEEPVAPRRLNPKVPADLQTICLKCLNKDGDKRYASALRWPTTCAAFSMVPPSRPVP